MKVGSLVECIDNDFQNDIFRWPNTPKKGEVYTIRKKRTVEARPGVLLEELINPEYAPGKEYGFYESHFREVQPPFDVTALFEKQLKSSNENRVNK